MTKKTKSFVKKLVLMCLVIGVGSPEAYPQSTVVPVGISDQSVLSQFVSRPDSTFDWKLIQREDTKKGTFLQVSLTSQTWRNTPWKHLIYVFFPANSSAETLFFSLQMDFDVQQARTGLLQTAQATGLPCAILCDIPNQPLFDGKQEEELLNFTFEQYLKTKDSSWPLLLPMVKSTVRTMDALQQISQRNDLPIAKHFVVAGHSKRGHTAWLTAALDKRISGLIVQGFNTLNSSSQIPHYFATYGELDQSALAARKVIEQINTPAGQSLLHIVDAYNYRDKLTMPKLVIVGTNDDYTPVDAINLYWQGMSGPKSVLSLPNTGHVGANHDPRLFPTAYSFIRSVAKGTTLPVVESALHPSSEQFSLVINTEESAVAARVWVAHSQTRDFREAQWTPSTLKLIASTAGKKPALSGRQFQIELDKPSSGYNAIIGEVEFGLPENRFTLSTVPYVVKGR